MALTIEGATVGYDKAGITSLLNEMHANVIDDAKAKLQNGVTELSTSVSNIWVGHSADQFKENMQTDVNKICEALDKVYDVLEVELSQIQARMGEADEQLVKSR